MIPSSIKSHRMTMVNLNMDTCVVAGAFTLLPGRYLGNLVFHQWLGLV